MQGSLDQPPIVIRSQRWQWRRGIAFLLPFYVFGIFPYRFGLDWPHIRENAFFFVMAPIALGIFALAMWGLIWPARLVLSPQGLKLIITWRTRSWGWDEVGYFRTVQYAGGDCVGFDYIKPRKARVMAPTIERASGAQGLLVRGMEIGTDEIAEQLNAARARWLSNEAVVLAPDHKQGLAARAWGRVVILLSGRIDRRFYWTVTAPLMVLAVVAAVSPLGLDKTWAALLFPWYFACRARLRDLNRSPFWLASLPVLVVLVGAVAAVFGVVGALWSSAVAVGGVSVLLGALPGDPNRNRYGPPPGGEAGRMDEVFS